MIRINETDHYNRRGPSAMILRKIDNGGIKDPREVPLPIGTTLIRFSSGPFIDRLAGGEWWLDMPGNLLVEAFADRNKVSIQEALSHMCAVPAEWNNMTLKVQFRTLAPLSAYVGIGNDALYEDRKTKRIQRREVASLDGRKVEQLYIPGLNHPDLRKQALIDRGALHMPAFGS